MILLQSHSRFLLQTLLNRLQNLEKGIELDHHWVEFDDVRYHVQVSTKNPHVLLLSVSLPPPSSETIFVNGLPFGAIDAIKAAYGATVQIKDPPRDGFNLTLKINLSKLPANQDQRQSFLVKIASVREVVLGAPLRVILKHLASRTVAPDIDPLVALVHRPRESFFLVPKADKVTVVYPMRFNDSIDTVLATSFLQEFVEARRTAGLHNTPPCSWSLTPPQELKEVSADALLANAGFVTFVIFPRHVEGPKLDRTVWNLSTFHAYVSYHVKMSDPSLHYAYLTVFRRIYAYTDAASSGILDSGFGSCQTRSRKENSNEQILQTAGPQKGVKKQFILIRWRRLLRKYRYSASSGEESAYMFLWTIQSANQGIVVACFSVCRLLQIMIVNLKI
ncbi:hypothetical protein Ahy_B01g051433 [Arachis hypogaea]|uniref:Arp2/3 complex 34 kDa subunit n=1 Tax=Arachis hypogaea TaxID=3818 RepID=A0A445ALU2_ARAHY|nr:hypothetical protein Ahy_B01g051433 [Arachis hypogaea]